MMPSVWDEAEKGTSVWDQAEAEPQGAISATKRFLRDVVVPTPARAVAGMQQGIGGMNQWIGETVIPDALGGKALADAGRQWVAEGKAVSEEIEREHPVDPHSWSGAAVTALNSIAQQAVPLTVGVVTGNPAIPLAAMGTQTAGQKYGQKRAEGFDILKSGMAAAGHGISEVATEKFATEKLFELVKAPVASTLAKMFGGELVGENVATITQDMIDKGYAKPGMTDREAANAVKEYFTSGEAWQAVKDTTKSTVLQTALMGGAAKGANRLLSTKQAVEPDTDLLAKKGDAQERSEIAQAVRETRNKPADVPSVQTVTEPSMAVPAYTGPVMDAEAATQEDIDLAAMQRENELYRQQQLMDRAGIPEVQQTPAPQVPTSFKTADGKARVKTKVVGEGVYQVDTTTVDEYGHKKTFSQEMSAEDAVKHIDSITPPVTRAQFMQAKESANGTDARNEGVAGDAEVKGDGQPGPQDVPQVQLPDEGQRGEVPGLRNEVQVTPYKATLYRGVAERDPLHSGGMGRGTYYTSDQAIAQSYAEDFSKEPGKVLTEEVVLQRPFRAETLEDVFSEFSDIVTDVNKRIPGISLNDADKIIQDRITEELQKRGYDGIVLKKSLNPRTGEYVQADEVVKLPGVQNDREIGEGVSRSIGVGQESGGAVPDQAGSRGQIETSAPTREPGAAEVAPVETAETAEAGATEAVAAVDQKAQETPPIGGTSEPNVQAAVPEEPQVRQDMPESRGVPMVQGKPDVSGPEAAGSGGVARDTTGSTRAVLSTLQKPKRVKDRLTKTLIEAHGKEVLNDLAKQGMIRFPGKGIAEITKAGEKWLNDNPEAPKSKLKVKKEGTVKVETGMSAAMQEVESLDLWEADPLSESGKSRLLEAIDAIAAKHGVEPSALRKESLWSQPGAIFSAKGEKSGLIAAIVKKELSPLINRLKDAYNVEVLQSERDLRSDLLDQVKSENVEGRVEGLYDPDHNRVILIADNLKNLARAEEVLKHELVHKGIAAVFGNRLNMHLDQIRAERKLKSRREAEEFIAEQGEQFAGQGAIKRFIASARQMLRDMGFKVKFSDNDVLSIARKSMEATEKGAVAIHADGARFSLKDKAQAVKEAMGEKTMKEHAASVLDWTHNMFNNPGGLGAIDHARELLAERNLFKGALDALQNTQHQIYQSMRKASKETKEKIFNYLEDAEADAMEIPAEFRQTAIKTKQMIMDVGAKLVERKMLPADIYEANKGRYLPRTYLKHIIGDEGRAKIMGGGSIKAYLGYLKKRLETTDEQRIAWGQIKDPGYLASRAYGLPMRDMEVFDYFDRLITLDEGRGSWVLPKMLTPWVVNGDKAIQQIGGVTYTKNDDGTVNLDIRKVSHVKTKHERVKGTDLDTLLGSDKLGAFVRGGGGSVVMKKEDGQPKATGWKRVGHIKYRTYADGTYKVEITNKIITNQKIDNVDPADLSNHVSESQATRIMDGKGKVINGRTVTPYWLAAEAERILTKQVPNQPEPDRTKAIEIAKRMRAKSKEMLAEFDKTPKEVAAHYTQMPDSPKYGALRGLVVRKELYNDVVGNMKITIGERSWPEIISDYLFIKGMAIWKATKTAMNIPGQIRNFVSNHFLLHMSGVPLAMVPIRMAQAANEMRTNGKHWQVAKRGGIKSSGLANTELYRAEQDLLDMAAQDKPWYHPRFILKWLNKGMDATGDLYQMWESMGKTAKIIHEMSTKRYRYKDGSTVSWYQSKEGAVNRVATEKEAVVEAHEALFDYSLAPGWVKWVRRVPLGSPFVTFTYKMLPAIIKTAAQRPLTFAPYLALSYGLPYLIMAMTGIDDKDDYDRLKETVVKYVREKLHTYILPVKDAKGRWQIIDIGYYFPWTGWLAFANHIAEGKIKTALADDLGLGGSPVIDLASAVMFNQDTFTKQPIYDEEAGFNEQAGQMMAYLYALGAPPWLTNRGAAGKLWSAMNDEIGKPGQMKPTVGQGLGSLVGANVYAFDPTFSREQNIKSMNIEISKQKSQMTSELKDRDLTKFEREKIGQKYQARIQKMNQEKLKYIAKSTPKDPSLFKR